MKMMSEKDYYENREIWQKELYLEDDAESLRFEIVLQNLPENVSSLLDVGCGNGAFLFLLEKKMNLEILGLERSKIAIKDRLCNTNIIESSIENIPFEDKSFDLITALEVLEHLPYDIYEKSLRELERVANKYIMITVPYKDNRFKIECPYCGCFFEPSYHLRSFNEINLSELFVEFELKQSVKIYRRKEFLFSGLLLSLYYKTLRRGLPATALCPQCGYSEKSEKNGGKEKSKAEQFLRFILPKKTKYRWILAIYERIDGKYND